MSVVYLQGVDLGVRRKDRTEAMLSFNVVLYLSFSYQTRISILKSN